MRGTATTGRRALLRAIAGVTASSMVGPAIAQPVEVLRELHIVDGVVPAAERSIVVNVGDRLRLRVTSDRAGELHLHAYRSSVTVAAGAISELSFTAFATGRFRFEWHPARGEMVGHDPAPLATLDVRPR